MGTKKFAFTAVLALLSLTADGVTGRGLADSAACPVADSVDGGVEYASPVERRTLDLAGFHGLKVEGPVVIRFTQGGGFAVVAEGPAEMFEQNDVKVKDGMLCVKMKDLRKKMGVSKKEFDKIPKVSVTEETGGRKVLNDPERLKQFGDCIVVWPMVLYVTAPTLDVIENKGALTLSTGDMAVADLAIFNKGQLDLSLGNVECSGLRIENKGVFKGGGDFNAGTVALENKGNMELVSDFSVSGAFDLKNNGTSKFNGSISAAQVLMSVFGHGNYVVDVEAPELNMKANGVSRVVGSFKGNNLSIESKGDCKQLLTVDCEKFTVNASGPTEIRAEGTADKTRFDCTGPAKIDMRKLNKF